MFAQVEPSYERELATLDVNSRFACVIKQIERVVLECDCYK
jgi:hypothetical protein